MKIDSLKHLSKYIGSGCTPSRKNALYWNSDDVPWLKTEQLGEYRIYNTNEYVSNAAVKECNMRIYPPNTISLAMYGEGKTRGRVSLIDIPMTTNQACCNIQVEETKADYGYIFYYLRGQYENLRQLSAGVRKNLNADDIKNFNVCYPDNINYQKKISTFLFSIDDKIALNNCVNATLEAMAKTLYDYWFVQFDFPDEKGRPYKTSCGKMVYNEELGREIPAGWEAGNLGELCTITRGVTYTKDVVSKFPQENYVPILRANNINGKRLNFDSLVYVPKQFISEEQKLNKNDILITMSSGSMEHIGKIARVWDDMPFSFGAFCSKISTKDVAYKNYVYEYLASTEFDTYIHNMCLGTNIRNLTNEYILNTFIPIPPMAILLLQRNLIDKLFDYIGGKEQEIQNLAALRDWLLPMLMNGQVGFKHNGQ